VFDVFIFVFIYVVPGVVVVVSYTLTGSRLLTADQSLRRQQWPAGGAADDCELPSSHRRRRQYSTPDSVQRHRHVASASPVDNTIAYNLHREHYLGVSDAIFVHLNTKPLILSLM